MLRALVLLLTFASGAAAQQADADIICPVEEQPQLIGGIDAFQESVRYPGSACRSGVSGRLFVEFLIDTEGIPREPTCRLQLPGRRTPDARLCAAAREAILAARFIPGQQRGRPVETRFTMPVRFEPRPVGACPR